jgi:hypothetical protein
LLSAIIASIAINQEKGLIETYVGKGNRKYPIWQQFQQLSFVKEIEKWERKEASSLISVGLSTVYICY